MARAYDFLAERFEELNDDCGYEEWSQYFIKGLRALGARENGLELGCGSGAFSRALAKAGYRMEGADISLPMLTKAEFLAREEGLDVSFFRADAARLAVPHLYDFILSPNDCYNYVPQKKLPAAFRRAGAALKKDGIFWFDVSSPYKFRSQIANNIFADDREDMTYLCFNSLKEDRTEMDVTLFVRRDDGAFDRFDEHHTQYIHEEKEILSALAGAGFQLLREEGKLGEKTSGSERLNFICRKK